MTSRKHTQDIGPQDRESVVWHPVPVQIAAAL
jgi:hypothetical protein